MPEDEVGVVLQHPAVTLLRSDDAPLLLTLLDRGLAVAGARGLPVSELTHQLTWASDGMRPHTARALLTAWSDPARGWLRPGRGTDVDEPHLAAAPAALAAARWVAGLGAPAAAPTRARLTAVTGLLRTIAGTAEPDPAVRLADLERRRAALDAEIAGVRAGQLDLPAGAELRDLHQLAAGLADGLLADLATAEHAVADADRELRIRLAAGDAEPADRLAAGLAEDDEAERAFRALHDALLSPAGREEITGLLHRVHEVAGSDPRLAGAQHAWLVAADRVEAARRETAARLRRDVARRSWQEDHQVLALLDSITRRALALPAEPVHLTVELDDTAPTVVLPLERQLYSPPRRRPGVDSSRPEMAGAGPEDQLEAHSPAVPLGEQVRRTLGHRPRVGLAEVLAAHPLRGGLTELVSYLALADDAIGVEVGGGTDSADDDAAGTQRVAWSEPGGRQRTATLPRVAFHPASTPAPSRHRRPTQESSR